MRGGTGQLDAVMLPLLLAVPIIAGDRHGVALLNREADTQRVRTLNLPGRGPRSPRATTITDAGGA